MDPNNPNVLYAALLAGGTHAVDARLGRQRAAASSRRPTAATTGPRSRATPACPRASWATSASRCRGANSNRVWAIIEADSGGVFRSDDGGATWTRTNTDRIAAPARVVLHEDLRRSEGHERRLRAATCRFQKSTDGGKTFRPVRGIPHGDSHDIWIDAERTESHDRRRRRRRERLDRRRPHVDATRTSRRRSSITSSRRTHFPYRDLRRAAGQLHAVRPEPQGGRHRHR